MIPNGVMGLTSFRSHKLSGGIKEEQNTIAFLMGNMRLVYSPSHAMMRSCRGLRGFCPSLNLSVTS